MATSTNNPKVTLNLLKIQAGTERTIVASWSFPNQGGDAVEKNVDHYEYFWKYATGDGIQYSNPESNEPSKTTVKYTTWDIPANVKHLFIKVKPVAKKKPKSVDANQSPYFTGAWAQTPQIYLDALNNMPEVAPAPTVTIKDNILTASVNITDSKTTAVKFRVVQDNTTEFNKSGLIDVTYGYASFSCAIEEGHTYKVQCISYNKKEDIYSEDTYGKNIWGEFSSDTKTAPGAVSTSSLSVEATSSTSVLLTWAKVQNADKYEVEYTTNSSYFDTSTQVQSMTVTSTSANISLQTGVEWFFRVRAISNDVSEEGKWSGIVSVILGREPTAPTTWSNVTTAIVGEKIILYWIHNTIDGSKQKGAELQLIVNGQMQPIINPPIEILADEENEKTSRYELTPSEYGDGAIIEWRVRTRGILASYSPWSVTRMIKIYAQPTLYLTPSGLENTVDGYTMHRFPLDFSAYAGPSAQTAIGYQITITSKSQYHLFDTDGNIHGINIGDILFSQYFSFNSNNVRFTFTPADVILMDYMNYNLKVTVTMDSGLSADADFDLYVSYDAISDYYLRATVDVDRETLTTLIYPECRRIDDESLIPNVSLSVIRIGYDNELVTVLSGIDNTDRTAVIDPHPSLNVVRYRIMAVFMDTGQIDFFDTSEEYVGVTDIVINWDEMREGLALNDNDENLIDPRWIGGMLRLPYNIDINDTMKPDAELVDYIGRKHSVAYYGTKTNHNSKWDVMIDKNDADTILALRTLGVWRDNVYVREPSGTGYWASIEINMSQKHNEPGVPVSLTITRVEGGV